MANFFTRYQIAYFFLIIAAIVGLTALSLSQRNNLRAENDADRLAMERICTGLQKFQLRYSMRVKIPLQATETALADGFLQHATKLKSDFLKLKALDQVNLFRTYARQLAQNEPNICNFDFKK